MQTLSIQPLAPVPAQASRHQQQQQLVRNDAVASQALKRIDSVCVVADAADSDAFVIQVFLSPLATSARLSTPMDAPRHATQPEEPPTREALRPLASSVPLQKRASNLREPDICLARSYTEFLALKSQLQQRVHVAHGVVPCAFCREVSSLTVWGGMHSSPLAMLAMTHADQVETFAAFVNELLELTKASYPPKRARPCSAQQDVPQLLHVFLTK